MSIPLQLKNLAKILLIGVVLFTATSVLSRQAEERISFQRQSPECRTDTVQSMFVRAGEQTKPEMPGYILASDGCVKAALPPVAFAPQVLAAIAGGPIENSVSENQQKSIVEYEVTGDETIASLADKFGISADSIAWANNLSKTAALKVGQKLVIPPVSGVIHFAVAGDTLPQIAKKYQASEKDIIAFNDLAGENDIYIGDVLMIPGGKILPPPAPKPASTAAKSAPSVSSGTALGLAAMPAGYFLCPVGAQCKRTQGMHFRNAVDLTGGYCGAPIYAAASGTVIKAKIGGWNGGAGNSVTISHMNGAVTTHYYHLQSVYIFQGQEVKKGDIIGTMGQTGRSTGCHLHFEVGGAENPF